MPEKHMLTEIDYYKIYLDNLKLSFEPIGNSGDYAIYSVKSVPVSNQERSSETDENVYREINLLRNISWHPVFPKLFGQSKIGNEWKLKFNFVPGSSLGDITCSFTFKEIWIISYGLFHALKCAHSLIIRENDATKEVPYMLRTLGRYQIVLDTNLYPHIIHIKMARDIPDENSDSITNFIAQTETAPECCQFFMKDSKSNDNPIYTNKPYTQKVDIFSLGMILITIITAKDVFSKDNHHKEKGIYRNFQNKMEAIKNNLRNLCNNGIFYPVDYLELIFQCIDFCPENRPTAEEVLNKLISIVNSESGSMGNQNHIKCLSINDLQEINFYINFLNDCENEKKPQVYTTTTIDLKRAADEGNLESCFFYGTFLNALNPLPSNNNYLKIVQALGLQVKCSCLETSHLKASFDNPKSYNSMHECQPFPR